MVLLAALAACAPREDPIIGVENPDIPVAAVEGTNSHDIYVMTTRQPATDEAVLYSGDRGSGLGFARVTVSLPPSHKPGNVERPRRLPPDPRRDMTVTDPVTFSSDSAFIRDMNLALRKTPGANQSTLVFVHGYNTSFADAVLRLGQFVEDSGFEGVPVLFTWASAARLLDYVYDLNSALSARNDLIDASQVLVRTNTTSINLVAHSMGNFLTVEAMKQARLENRFDKSGKMKNVILASADIDVDVFKDQMSVFDPSERRFYVLISEDDKALAASRFLARGVSRVGDSNVDELDALGVTVIDLTNVQDTESTNHSKFANSPGVVQVIGGEMLKGDSLHTGPQDQNALANVFNSITGTVGTALGTPN